MNIDNKIRANLFKNKLKRQDKTAEKNHSLNLFQQNTRPKFEDIYKDYSLNEYVEEGYASKQEMEELYNSEPQCLDALKELHVVAAISQKTVKIHDLKKLTKEQIRHVVQQCNKSDDVVHFLQNCKNEKNLFNN